MSAAGAAFWKALPFGHGVTWLANDANGLGALGKPAGVLSHPNSGKDPGRSLLTSGYDKESESYGWTGTDGSSQRLWLLNRLDSATSGVILVAANQAVADEIKRLFASHAVTKIYNALVFGRPRAGAETWRDRLGVERRGGTVRTGSGNIPAQSEMRALKSGGDAAGITLIELKPVTGRTHQLRIQCARRHLPIVGDATYGDFKRNREFAKASGSKRLFLHSVETRLEYTLGRRVHAFRAVAPLPAEFAAALGK